MFLKLLMVINIDRYKNTTLQSKSQIILWLWLEPLLLYIQFVRDIVPLEQIHVGTYRIKVIKEQDVSIVIVEEFEWLYVYL